MMRLIIFICIFILGFILAEPLIKLLLSIAEKFIFFIRAAYKKITLIAGRLAGNGKVKFEDAFPDALNFITNALKSGSGIMQALDMLVKESPGIMADEFSVVLKEMKIGVSLQDALSGLAARLKNAELDMAVAAISISQETGGSLSESLEKISAIIRERYKIMDKTRALTSQGRMQAMVIGFMPVIMCAIIFFIDPLFISPLFTRPFGWVMIVSAVIMEMLGMAFIKKIISIEV
jgi:tight adherence protein B